MRLRVLWALLSLAAVFAMHGLSSVAGEQGVPAPSVAEAAVAPVHGPQASAGHAAHTGADAASPAVGNAPAHPAGHDLSLHALMVCLAVLAGGIGVALAALAAWLARRVPVTLPTPARARLRAAIGRARRSLPAPELSRLCVLRV